MGTASFLKYIPVLSGLLCLATALPALAGDQPGTLSQLVTYAVQNNGELKAFRAEKGIYDAGKIRADLLPNPTLDLAAGSGALTGSKNESSLALGLSQEFFLSGKRDKRLTVAEKELEIYSWLLADKERLLRDEVKTAFYDALLAKERVTLTDRSIALSRQLLEVTAERLAAGDIPELEMNLVKVELARDESARIHRARALQQSQAKLWSLVGLPVDNKPPPVEGKLDADVAITKTVADLKQLASANRPDIKALEAERARSEADVALARAETVPNLTAGLEFRRDTASMEIGGVEGKDTAYTVGVKLSLPLPLFDRNQAGIQEATAKRSRSESRLIAARAAVAREVETAYVTLQNAAALLSLYKTGIIPQLEENLQLTQEAYRIGEVGILAVIQEQKKFFEVSDGYLTTLHDRQTALVKLEAAIATEISGGAQ